METVPGHLRIAAIADLHCDVSSGPDFKQLFAYVQDHADLLLLGGDLTNYGLPDEARALARDLALLKMPVLAVLGNHDFEAGLEGEITHILTDAGVKILDGTAQEVRGVGFAGAKGFAGGFGVRTLEPWGEPIIKRFVQEALDETLKLERALSRLRTKRRIALMHYSPVLATVEGEPLEIHPFLGSSRLEEPLNRYEVTAVFHGHAHRGAAEGQTQNGIPVYNVSLPLLRRTMGDKPPIRIVEVAIEGEQSGLSDAGSR